MEFSSPEYWSGWPFPPPADLLNPGIELGSPALQADYLQTELSGKPPPPPPWLNKASNKRNEGREKGGS